MLDIMKGLHVHVRRLDGTVNSGTLGANSAAQLEAIVSGIGKPFLVKKLRIQAYVSQATGHNPVLCVGREQATAAEIATALATQNVDPEGDATYVTTQAARQNVWWETVRISHVNSGTGYEDDHVILDLDISVGGGKGLPIQEGDGIAIYCYNPQTASFTTAVSLIGVASVMGVWLND